ncbi:cold-regulated 413 plasma membrane protein 1 isoform X2 [Cryptomeria japonica]|uniref:cold-regulated 413 plasma membrane protein 1 isoform X2 n=1 Tax=Cryptomeria japonica TaxID=3369 RepID=UPI0027DAAA4A|nr:cold-regulated 413 plasma membrane protein 1 isoform X2 [Cryptomeria japonica]
MTLANGNDSSSAVQAAALFDASDHDATFPRYLAIAAALKDFGKWITFLFVTLHLFFRQYILDFCGFPVALLLLIVTVPQMLTRCLRNNIIGATISVAIGLILLDGHIRYRRPLPTFSKVGYCVNSLAIIALLISPLLEVYQFTNEGWQQSSDGWILD